MFGSSEAGVKVATMDAKNVRTSPARHHFWLTGWRALILVDKNLFSFVALRRYDTIEVDLIIAPK